MPKYGEYSTEPKFLGDSRMGTSLNQELNERKLERMQIEQRKKADRRTFEVGPGDRGIVRREQNAINDQTRVVEGMDTEASIENQAGELLADARRLNLNPEGERELARVTSGFRELQKKRSQFRPAQYDQMINKWSEQFARSNIGQYHTPAPTMPEQLGNRTQSLPNGYMAVQQPDGKIDIKDVNPSQQAAPGQQQGTPMPFSKDQVEAIIASGDPRAEQEMLQSLAHWVREQNPAQTNQPSIHTTGGDGSLAHDATTWYPSSMDQQPLAAAGGAGFSDAQILTPDQRSQRLAYGTEKQDRADRLEIQSAAMERLQRKNAKKDKDGNDIEYTPDNRELAKEMRAVMQDEYELQMLLLGKDPDKDDPRPIPQAQPEEPASPSDIPLSATEAYNASLPRVGPPGEGPYADLQLPPPLDGPEVTPEMIEQSQQADIVRRVEGAARQQFWNATQGQPSPGVKRLKDAMTKSGSNRGIESLIPAAGIAASIAAGNPNAADDIADAAASAIENKTEHFSKLSAPDQAVELQNMVIVPRDQWDTYDFQPGEVYYDDKLNRYKIDPAELKDAVKAEREANRKKELDAINNLDWGLTGP